MIREVDSLFLNSKIRLAVRPFVIGINRGLPPGPIPAVPVLFPAAGPYGSNARIGEPTAMRPHVVIAAGLASLLFTASTVHAAEPDMVRSRFREVDTLFANPGQGWMSQLRSPSGEPRFPCSVIYIRFNWAEVEPEQGRYNWTSRQGEDRVKRP
jgi:hypothetical protein